jgi:hypothetical protein
VSKRGVRLLLASTSIAILLGLAACVSPALDAGHYQQQASTSVDAAESELQTTRLALEAATDERIFATTADETVSASEAAINSVSESFRAVQPPVGSDDTQRVTARFLGAAEVAVTQARIAVRRRDEQAMLVALDHIQRILARVGPVRTRLR